MKLRVLFLCFAISLPAVATPLPIPDQGPALRIQGSNTIGAALGPALVKGLMEHQGLQGVHSEPGAGANEQRVVGKTRQGKTVTVEVAAHGSSTGFAALKNARADLAASSRPIKDSELVDLEPLGDLKSPDAEQVIAIDGLAIILNPRNPLNTLNTEQLAQIFNGEVSTWEALGGIGGAIHLYARDDQSGTYDTFKELVLSRRGKPLAGTAQRFESSEALSDAVSHDPQGIGFIGLPYVRQARAVAIGAGDAQALLPSATSIATEDYPLSRRLFFYNRVDEKNPWAQALVAFAHSPRGQAIVEKTGFIAQSVQAVAVAPTAGMPAAYAQLSQQAQRLSVNFRFQEGSATLDNKAQRDIGRVLDYLTRQGKLRDEVVLVGFGDAKSDPARAELLSKLRAMAVRRELAKGGVMPREVTGLGDELPVAANSADSGRMKNRRVEVWVY